MTAVIPADADRGWATVVSEVDRLGAAVQAALGGRPPQEDSFADLAAGVMRAVRPQFTVPDVLSTLITAAQYPDQADPASQYGEPGVTLWRGPGFHIDAYLHITPNTSVHSHSFAGAFMVAHGVSAHVRYDLPEAAAVAEGVVVGDLQVRDAAILAVGEAQPIPPGFGLIHSVVHVTQPGLSIVVRTPGTEENAMHAFFLPGLGIRLDTAYGTTARKKMLLLDTLLRLRDPAPARLMVTLLDNVADATAIALAGKYAASGAADLAPIMAETRHRDQAWVPKLLQAAAAGSFHATGAAVADDERARMAAYARSQLPAEVASVLLTAVDASAATA